MSNSPVHELVKGCRKKDAASQKALFVYLYDYVMTIANRYGSSHQDTEEIANDSLYKVLSNIEKYNNQIPLKLWVRKIVINTGIDCYRKNKNKEKIALQESNLKSYNQGAQNLDKEYLIALLNQLTPQYKLVFILYVIEGYTHEEIADKLNIAVGTSKSNLSKARAKLKKLIVKLKINEHIRQ